MLRFAPTFSLNPQSRYQLPSVTPRDRYFAVLAEARAAEAEYVSALLRDQRLREDRSRHQAIRKQLLLDSLHSQETVHPADDVFTSTYPAPFPVASYSAPCSHALDFEQEEQELFSTFQRRQYAAESRRIELLRQQEALALQRQRRRQEEDLRQLQAARAREHVHGRRAEVEGFEQVLGLMLTESLEDIVARKEQHKVAQRKPVTQDQLLARLIGHGMDDIAGRKEQQRVAQRKPLTQSELFAHFLGVAPEPVVAAVPSQQHRAPQSRPKVAPQQDFLAHFLGGAIAPKESQHLVQPVSKSVSQPQAQASSSASPKVEAEARSHGNPEAEFRNTIQALISSVFGSVDATPGPQPELVPQASVGQAAPKAPSAAPVATPSPSLKEQLEARLLSDSDAEIRDTVQALIASLYHTSSVSQGPSASDPKAGSAAEGSGKAKGKAKEVTFDIPTSAPTSVDVMHALDTLHNIEASFHALESDFVFPSNLDFAFDSASPPSSPSSALKLAYTSKNAPVRHYEHAMSSLLTQLDSIDSLGSEDVRNKRKEIVSKVETALEVAEREIEGRSSVWVKRLAAAETVRKAEDGETSQTEPAGTVAVAIAESLVPVVEDSSPVTREEPADTAEESLEQVVSTITSEELEPPASTAIPSSSLPIISDNMPTVVEGPLAQPTTKDPIAVEGHEDMTNILESTIPSPYPPTSSIISPPSETTPDIPDAATASLPSSSSDATQSTDVLDTFLLPASPEESPKSGGRSTLTAPHHNEADEVVIVDASRDDAGSDWSEVEA